MDLDDALQDYVVESRDLLTQMEDALLALEQTPNDADSINAVFRAAHTIKGSAGLFGLDFVVSFTHVAESVLDKVRSQEILIDEALSALLLEVSDHIGQLIDVVAAGTLPSEGVVTVGAALTARLSSYLGAKVEAQIASQNNAAVTSVNETSGTNSDREMTSENWHISLRFGQDVFRNGMDPFSFIRYLQTIGTITHIETLADRIPPLEEFDPESCYLGFEISLESDADKPTIEAVFEFVRDDCEIHILEPHSSVGDYIQLIDAITDDAPKLGEILVQCGALTPAELAQVLAQQSEDNTPQDQKPLLGEVLVESHLVQPSVVHAALDKQKQMKEAKSNEANLIRVDANKLDNLINMVGELIIAGASAGLVAHRFGQSEMVEATSNISTLVEQVRDSALALRMVQIGATFNRFQRVVRDVSKDLGKDIRLVISGEETELDKTVVEKIGDPLTHLVRNSMDHGIESADVRVANGKPPHGTLKLNAYHDAGNIVIEVSDDGAGLNKEKILKKAIERGIVSESHNLSDREIYNLIFEAGFSTADTVSNLSGRGVGMDVVRRNIQALRGTIEIQSQPSMGSTMRIRLPLTLAIIDGFLVGVGNSTYVIPLDMVIECIELDAWADQHCEGNYLNLRGEVLPYRRLREHFEVDGESAKRENVVVVRYGDSKVGLVVDRLLGEFQTVIKPLGKVFSKIQGIGGFTILGTGDVALILDVPGLLRQVTHEDTAKLTDAVT